MTLHSGWEGLRRFEIRRRDFSMAPRYDLAPSHVLGVVRTEHDGLRVFTGMRWGLEPSWWDRERHEGHRLFTARAETLTSKPSFSEGLRSRRCIVPVDGFWVWQSVKVEGKSRQIPFYVRARNGEPFALAALWEETLEGPQVVLITTESNRLLAPLNERMPAILRRKDEHLWLDPDLTSTHALKEMLQPLPLRELEVVPTDPDAEYEEALVPHVREREILTAMYGEGFKPNRPKLAPRPRVVRREAAEAGHVFFKTRSFTRDELIEWHPVVDVECGHVFCDCPDFRYRHARHEPDIWTPHWWCKHLERAVENCKRHGELPVKA
jgi:putative SOS response-associated peptidase YedK